MTAHSVLAFSIQNVMPTSTEFLPEGKDKPRILLVEAYEANILVAGTYLEIHGFDFEVARSGIEAVEKIKEGNFDIILMDVKIPGINGFDATQIIRDYEKATNKHRMPIIGMTANALTSDRHRCIAAGMDDHIPKPLSGAELIDKLERFIKNKSAP
jgi:CheY-like chemotaxis protein